MSAPDVDSVLPISSIAIDHAGVYDESYWNNQDPDWYGRVTETLRLVLLSNALLARDPAQIEILDFGCGMGTFIQTAREKLNMQAWGHDIIEPKFGKEFFLKELPEKKFDIIVSCEVLEHLPFPYEILKKVLQVPEARRRVRVPDSLLRSRSMQAGLVVYRSCERPCLALQRRCL